MGSIYGDSVNLGVDRLKGGSSYLELTGAYLIDLGNGPDSIHGANLIADDSIDMGAGDDTVYINYTAVSDLGTLGNPATSITKLMVERGYATPVVHQHSH